MAVLWTDCPARGFHEHLTHITQGFHSYWFHCLHNCITSVVSSLVYSFTTLRLLLTPSIKPERDASKPIFYSVRIFADRDIFGRYRNNSSFPFIRFTAPCSSILISTAVSPHFSTLHRLGASFMPSDWLFRTCSLMWCQIGYATNAFFIWEYDFAEADVFKKSMAWPCDHYNQLLKDLYTER